MTLVIFESTFGSTEAIAQAIAEGLAKHLHVEVVEAGDPASKAGEDVDLLVAGGPTQGFGLSRQETRDAGVKKPTVWHGRSPNRR